MDGSDINAVVRSPDHTCLATADDFGFVNLFKFPAPVDNAAYNKNGGHSSHVTNVAFTLNEAGNKYLVSTGGEDKCVFQWKYLMSGAADAGFGEEEDAAGDQSCPPFDCDGMPDAEKEEEAEADPLGFASEEDEEGD